MNEHIPASRLIFLLPALILPGLSLPSDFSGRSADGPPPTLQVQESGPVVPGAGPMQAFHDAYANAILFTDAADEAKVKVTPEEVNARLAAYARLYPGQDVGFNRVENLLKAEKYLASQGQDVDNRDIENGLADLGSKGIAIADGNREALKLTLKTELLFKKENVRQLGEKALELTTLKNQEIMENSRQQWPFGNLRLQGDPDECLANLHGECWATVEEYNAVVAEIRTPRVVPLDSARVETLRAYLGEKHLAKSAPPPVTGSQADSIIEAMKGRKSRRDWHERVGGMGRPVMDQKTLWATYDRYYRELFRARLEASIELIGSSDSSHIDSLYRVLQHWAREASSSRSAGRAPPQEPSMPWLAFKEDELPRILSAATDTLKAGESTPPVKTNLGFFLAKVRDIRRIKEVSFDAAFHQIIFLATRDKFLRMDSVIEAKSQKYYRTHKDEFRIPDTLDLTAWLVPFRLQGNGKSKRYFLTPAPGTDTSHFAPLKISSLVLTRKWQNLVREMAGVKPPTGRKEAAKPFFGPLKAEYGQWYFRIDRTRKAGGFQSYAASKPEIIRRLTAPEIEPDTLANDSVKNEVLLTLGIAGSNLRRERLKWESLPEEEVRRLIRTGEIDTSEFPKGLGKEQLLAFSKNKLFEQDQIRIRNGENDFLREVEIDYARLFKP